MSKHSSHKHHHTEGNNTNSPSNTSQTDTGNNINMQELSKMFNNVDMNQLSSMLSSLNLNANSPNSEQDSEPLNKNINNDNINNNNTNNSNTNIQLLNSLRPFLNPQKIEMLDKIIQIYSKANATK